MSHLTSGGPAVRRTALAIVLGLSAAVLSPMPGRADAPALPRSTPEAQGVSSSRLLAFVDAADRRIDAMNSFMLLRHGQVVAEGWWAPDDAQQRHLLYSLTKSFTSTAVGLAIAEGKLTLDDKVLSHFPDAAPAAPGDELKAMRVRDLLTMSTGHHAEPAFTPKEPWTKTFLSAPVAHKPGTFFLYNSPASYMLSATVQKVTGTPLRAWLGPRLFDVIGITDPVWETSPEGISIGGTGLKLKTEDIARFGQLYLRKGEWQGKRVLPAAWVELATSRQMSNGSNPESDWEQGYGFQFWRTRHGYYRGDGAFGQFCVILQDLDAVVVITSGVRSMPAGTEPGVGTPAAGDRESAAPGRRNESPETDVSTGGVAPADADGLAIRDHRDAGRGQALHLRSERSEDRVARARDRRERPRGRAGRPHQRRRLSHDGGVRPVGEGPLRVRRARRSAGRGKRRVGRRRHLESHRPVHGNAVRRHPDAAICQRSARARLRDEPVARTSEATDADEPEQDQLIAALLAAGGRGLQPRQARLKAGPSFSTVIAPIALS